MLVTRSSEYAIELVLYLVTRPLEDSFAPLNKIAEEISLSFHFLGKIAQILVHAGILKTYRGPNGGVALARQPQDISLFDIVSAIEGDAFLNQCLIRPMRCADDNPCPLHDVWSHIRSDIQDVFLNVSMDSFVES